MYVCMCVFPLINVIGIVGVTSMLQFLSTTGPCACPVCTVRAGHWRVCAVCGFCDAFVPFGLCGTLSSLLGPPHPWNDCQAVR